MFDCVKGCSDDTVVKKCRDIVVEGKWWKGRPWVVDGDLRSLKIGCDLAQNWTE